MHTEVLYANMLKFHERAMFPFAGDLLEDLPTWLLDWRQHLQRAQQPGFAKPMLWSGVGTSGIFFNCWCWR